MKPEYDNYDMCDVIDRWVHDARHRYILKRRYCDKTTFDKLAEETGLDDSTVKRIVYKNESTIFRHLKK